MVYFSGFFSQLGFSRGFLSIAVMAGDIIFFCLAGPLGVYTGTHTVIFRGVSFILFSRRKSKAAMGKGGGGGIIFFRVPNCTDTKSCIKQRICHFTYNK